MAATHETLRVRSSANQAADDLTRLLARLTREPGWLGGMRMLRWPEPLADAAAVRDRLQALLPGDWLCLVLDRHSLLLLGGRQPEAAVPGLLADPASAGAEVWRPVGATEAGIEFVADAPAPARGRSVLTDTRFRYFPLWDIRAQHAFCYLCEPMWDTGDGTLRAEQRLSEPPENPRHLLALDLEVLSEATRRIEAAMESYGLLTVLVPVHWGTLTEAATLDRFTRFCEQRTWPLIDNLYIELIGMPADASRQDLEHAHRLLGPFCRALLLRVDGPGFDRFDAVPETLFLSVGVSFRQTRADAAELETALGSFARRAHGARLRCHVHGLETDAQTLAAGQAGVDYLGSDSLAPPLEPEEPELETPDAMRLLRKLKEAQTTS